VAPRPGRGGRGAGHVPRADERVAVPLRAAAPPWRAGQAVLDAPGRRGVVGGAPGRALCCLGAPGVALAGAPPEREPRGLLLRLRLLAAGKRRARRRRRGVAVIVILREVVRVVPAGDPRGPGAEVASVHLHDPRAALVVGVRAVRQHPAVHRRRQRLHLHVPSKNPLLHDKGPR